MTQSNDHAQPQLRASVIVPAYNAAHTLVACLTALNNQSIPRSDYEIIVIDDCSSDDTAEVAEAYGARVERFRVNQGRSTTRNRGAEVARGEILLFTDADCEPIPTWIEKMLAPFARDADVVGVKGAYYCRQTEPVARFTQLELEDKYEVMAQQSQIDFIDTYAAAYKRDVFLRFDGFDQRLSYSMCEDQDFSFKLADAGLKMVFAPEARVYHQHVTSWIRYIKRKYTIGKWKAVILQRHPDRTSDSRTPLTLKMQFGLALLMFPLLPLALVWRPLRVFIGGMAGAFVASSIPLIQRTAEKDPALVRYVLPMLAARAIGLGVGYVAGVGKVRRSGGKYLDT